MAMIRLRLRTIGWIVAISIFVARGPAQAADEDNARPTVSAVLAAMAAGRPFSFHDEAVETELIRIVRKGDTLQSDLAIRALGTLRSQRAIGVLCEQLTSTRHATRRFAAAALARIGPASIPKLTRLLDSSSPPQARAAAIATLAKLGAWTPKAPTKKETASRLDRKRLEQLAGDKDVRVRVAVVQALATIGEPGIRPLIKLLQDGDVVVVNQAHGALRKLQKEATTPVPDVARALAGHDARKDTGFRWSENRIANPFSPDPSFEDDISIPRDDSEWLVSRTYNWLGDFAERPGDEVLRRIRVEWEHPKLNVWKKLLIVRGRLYVAPDEREGRRSVDWFQGVAVHAGWQSDGRYDWSQGAANDEAITAATVTDQRGRFAVVIDMAHEPPSELRARRRQFGLSLAVHRRLSDREQRLIWSSISPVISSSVKILEIEHGPPRSNELERIHQAAAWPRSTDAGADLIRAVNALHRLGKPRALKTLEQYIDLMYDNHSLDDHAVVSWLLLVLFEPARVDTPPPMLKEELDLVGDESTNGANWPSNPLAIVDDIPFMVGTPRHHGFGGGGLGGGSPIALRHIQWYRENAVLRDRPLNPRGNPVDAAEAILRSPQFQHLDKEVREAATRLVRLQAISMVASPLKLFRIRSTEDPELRDEGWNELVQRATRVGIRWSSARRAFVTRPPVGE